MTDKRMAKFDSKLVDTISLLYVISVSEKINAFVVHMY